MDINLVEDIEYHVCENCGNVVEIQVAESDNPVLCAIDKFESKYLIKLPKNYKTFLEKKDLELIESDPIKIIEEIPTDLKYYLDESHYRINGFLGLQLLNKSYSLSADYLSQEWDTPKSVVLIAGDGHTWIGLDYRSHKSQPPVVFMAGENWGTIQLLSSFDQLLEYV